MKKLIVLTMLAVVGCATTTAPGTVAAPSELTIACAAAQAGLAATQTVPIPNASIQAALAKAQPVAALACNGASAINASTLQSFVTTAMPTILAAASLAPNPDKNLISWISATQAVVAAASAAAAAAAQ
jgi:hypothetical protein